MGIVRYLLILIVLSVLLSEGNAQQRLDISADGLKKYAAGDYSGALEIFSNDTSTVSKLFAGKSEFALGRYSDALLTLGRLQGNAEVFPEILYTRALVYIQLRNYVAAADALFECIKMAKKTELKKVAESHYAQLFGFVSDKEKAEIARSSLYKEVRLKAENHDSKKSEFPAFSATIGLALPLVGKEDELFEVSQGLFNGFSLAVELFNEEQSDYKVFIRHINTSGDTRPAEVLKRTMDKEPVDVLFGPLFSSQASEMGLIAETYGLPMLAPLANSDTLSMFNPFVFQFNPVFGVRGRAMARFAVTKMGLDSVCVIAEKRSLGEAEALAFVDEASRLGAKLTYLFLADMEYNRYDISPMLQVLTKDPVLIDSLGYIRSKAVYMPFTGQAAASLIQNAVSELQVINPEICILGSEEWGTTEILIDPKKNLQIYFTQGFQDAPSTKTAQDFRNAYKNRFGSNAGQWAFVGYDAGQFLTQSLITVRNPSRLRRYWIDRGLHEGLVARVNFIRSNVNKGVRIVKLDKKGKIEIR